MKVCILTSVHSPWDARILHKEARSLAQAGHQVTLIAQNKAREQMVDGVRLLGLPKTRSRWGRPRNWLRLVRLALRERADVYHLHDPELLPWGLLLQWRSRRPVIYDAHEDYAAKVLVRGWIPAWLRPGLRALVTRVEPALARRLAATITADHLTAESLAQRGVRQPVVLYNYPLLSVCAPPSPGRWEGLPTAPTLLYVGTLGADRGLWVMLETLASLHRALSCAARLVLVGGAKVPGLQAAIQERVAALGIAHAVELAGYVPHEQLEGYLQRAHLGFLAHDPLIYARNIPTKLFEYMAAGLPIVTTRAAMTTYYLEQAPAGVLVDSQDPRDYAQAIVNLWRDPERLRAMSQTGRQAFEQRFNWESEGIKLVDLYQELATQWASRKM